MRIKEIIKFINICKSFCEVCCILVCNVFVGVKLICSRWFYFVRVLVIWKVNFMIFVIIFWGIKFYELLFVFGDIVYIGVIILFIFVFVILRDR